MLQLCYLSNSTASNAQQHCHAAGAMSGLAAAAPTSQCHLSRNGPDSTIEQQRQMTHATLQLHCLLPSAVRAIVQLSSSRCSVWKLDWHRRLHTSVQAVCDSHLQAQGLVSIGWKLCCLFDSCHGVTAQRDHHRPERLGPIDRFCHICCLHWGSWFSALLARLRFSARL